MILKYKNMENGTLDICNASSTSNTITSTPTSSD